MLYTGIRILRPSWWAVWIGPQQQQEPKSALGDKCALDWPLDKHCPTQGCVAFTNITLRDVYIEQPELGSPGVVLGNVSHANMRGIVFQNVSVKYTDGKPHKVVPAKDPAKVLGSNDYACEGVRGCSVGSNPPPPCFTVVSPGVPLPPECH